MANMISKNKLVRDKMLELFESQGRIHVSYILSDPEYDHQLRNKLKEETAEFLTDNNLEELADILEVIYALAKNIGYTKQDLENARAAKAEKYGIFEKKIYLVTVEQKKN